MIEPVMVCVVETGIPQIDARITVAAPPVSAQNPENGFNLVIRLPIVRTIRQPPVSVPRPIAAWAERMIQIGRPFMFGRVTKRKPGGGVGEDTRLRHEGPPTYP